MIALSTANKEALIAIKIKDKTSFKTLDANCKHSENVLPAIDKMLDEIGYSLKDNDCYAVVVGAGSFTGIRIGVALIKGFNQGVERKIVALTSFELIAYSYLQNFKPEQDFYVVLYALSGLYYVSKFDSSGKMVEEAKVITKEQYESLQGTRVGLKEEGVGDIQVQPSPEELLSLSQQYYKQNKFTPDSELKPLYLRKSQAEVSLELKDKKV